MLDIFKKASGSLKYCIVTPAILAILYLISIAKLEYGYYTFVRIFSLIALGAFLFMYWTASSAENKSFLSFPTITATVILILFNPILPLEFSKQVWTVLDVLSAIAMLAITVYLCYVDCYLVDLRHQEEVQKEIERKEAIRSEKAAEAEKERRHQLDVQRQNIIENWQHRPDDPGISPLPDKYWNYYKKIKRDPHFPMFSDEEICDTMAKITTSTTMHTYIEIYLTSKKEIKRFESERWIIDYFFATPTKPYPEWYLKELPSIDDDYEVFRERSEVLTEHEKFYQNAINALEDITAFKNLYNRAYCELLEKRIR